ncbi:MAG: glycosyltransferase [Candidatus Omnitrophica bacterium]|nr:glycosyltransferase [Candidatus Omnitrophota bacterium]
MKVLFLTNDINLHKGGQQIANKYLLETLKRQYKVLVVNLKFFPEAVNYGRINCDTEIDFDKFSFFNGLKDLVSSLKNISTSKNFDRVVISANPFSSILVFSVIKFFNLFKNSKFFHWCHIDPFASILTASRIPFILYPLGLLLYNAFDKVVTTNPYMTKSFEKYYFVPKDKIEMITYPLRPDFKKLISEKVKLNFSKPVIITLTRLTTIQKDPVTLIKAFKIVRSQFPTASLIFLGDGPEKDMLIKLVREMDLKESVYFLGFTKNPFPYIKRSDVFVLSSKSEGTPIALIEAQACGIPIVSTDCPVGPRWILADGKAGILVKIGDEKEIASGIVKFLNDKEERRIKVKFGYKFNKLFSFSLFQKRWINFINNPNK